MKKLLQFSFFLMLSLAVEAQDLPLFGMGCNYVQNGKISKKLSYTVHLMSVYQTSTLVLGEKRFYPGHTHFVPHLILNKTISPKLTIGGGYAYGRHDIFGLRENEHRFLAQTSFKQTVKNFNLSHRGRFEYRTPLNLKTNIRSDAAILRYQLGMNYPLYDTKKLKNGFYLTAAVELFGYLKGATNGPVSSKNGGFISEAWSNAGLGYAANRNRFELGYGFQRLVRNQKQELRNFNLCQITYVASVNWDDVVFWYN
jgi:Protein of unknown function (DUF2490)